MKTPKWTKADENRAAKMGWRLHKYPGAGYGTWTHSIKLSGNRFKSDDEAITHVMEVFSGDVFVDELEVFGRATCRKALFLCAKG